MFDLSPSEVRPFSHSLRSTNTCCIEVLVGNSALHLLSACMWNFKVGKNAQKNLEACHLFIRRYPYKYLFHGMFLCHMVFIWATANLLTTVFQISFVLFLDWKVHFWRNTNYLQIIVQICKSCFYLLMHLSPVLRQISVFDWIYLYGFYRA